MTPSPSAPRAWLIARPLAAVAAAFALSPPALSAQLPTRLDRTTACRIPEEDTALARHFAPTLIFSPGETDFPTVPFFTAFDGVDNFGGGGGRDFDDVGELLPRIQPVVTVAPRGVRAHYLVPRRRALRRSRPLEPRVSDRVSWDALYAESRGSAIDDGVEDERPGTGVLPAVFYRIRPVSERARDDLWRFLRKDSQAWRRFDMEARFDSLGTEDLISLEYYQYYLDDQGLTGHKQDIEFSFVFLTADPALRCGFRVMVGAGHDPRTPNNVLVLFDGDDDDEPRHVAVELGGHASAPSRDRGPGFRVGWDVNWHASEAWGTRDLLASTGTSFIGPYRVGMTFARDAAAGLNTVYRPEHRYPDDWACDPDDPPPDEDRGCRTDERAYQLLRVQPFEELAGAIGDRHVDRAQMAFDAIEDDLRREDGTRTFEAPVVDTALLEALSPWLEGLYADDGEVMAASQHSPWLHAHYLATPSRILKEHLYPPVSSALVSQLDRTRLFVYGLGTVFDREHQVYAGAIIPEIPWPVDIPGLVEFQAGLAFSRIESPRIWKPTVALQYDSEYREYFGWYARATWTKDRRHLTGDPLSRDVAISGGLSVLFWTDPHRFERGFRFLNTLRLRVGPRADVRSSGLLDLTRVGVEFFLAFRQ